jgi:SRSO17 transposase
VAAPPSLDLVACEAGFALFAGRIADRFRRVEPRRHASALVRALIAELPRVNCWTLAEHAGYASPDAFQHLLSRARWDHDGVRDDLREFVTERLGTENSVLVIDETGDVKKGTSTVGTQRQYTGTAGARISITVSDGFPRGLFGRVAVPMCGRAIRVSV